MHPEEGVPSAHRAAATQRGHFLPTCTKTPHRSTAALGPSLLTPFLMLNRKVKLSLQTGRRKAKNDMWFLTSMALLYTKKKAMQPDCLAEKVPGYFILIII